MRKRQKGAGNEARFQRHAIYNYKPRGGEAKPREDVSLAGNRPGRTGVNQIKTESGVRAAGKSLCFDHNLKN